MAKLIYSMLTSLDGYTEDEHGRFSWGAPEDEAGFPVIQLRSPRKRKRTQNETFPYQWGLPEKQDDEDETVEQPSDEEEAAEVSDEDEPPDDEETAEISDEEEEPEMILAEENESQPAPPEEENDPAWESKLAAKKLGMNAGTSDRLDYGSELKARPPAPRRAPRGWTDNQWRVAELLSQGWKQGPIAIEMNVSASKVKEIKRSLLDLTPRKLLKKSLAKKISAAEKNKPFVSRGVA